MSQVTYTEVADRKESRMNVALFLAIVSTALSLAASLAYVFALPNKIGMTQEHYFIVQGIYAGWWQFAFVLVIQIVSIGAVMLIARRESLQFWCGLIAMLCVIGAQVLFWGYTQPANSATQNWTLQPENWQQLRDQWEYSHAAGALLQLVAFLALVLASVFRVRRV